LALIDTGATATCIDEQAAQELGLPVIDVAKMTSATHSDQQCNVYPVQINLVPPGIVLNSPRTVGAALAAQGLLVLIGRDALRNCTLFYNGPTGQFTLSL
jgi:predicted aspartyl protease